MSPKKASSLIVKPGEDGVWKPQLAFAPSRLKKMKGLGGGGGGGGGGGADEMANLSNTFDAQTATGDQRRPDGDMARGRASAYCKAESKKENGKSKQKDESE